MGHSGFADLLVTGAHGLLLVAAAWAAAIAVALLLELATAGRVRATWACPAPVRRTLLAGLGLVLSGGAIGLPATAAPPRPRPPVGPTVALPVPDRAVGGVAPAGAVVRRGDTLWDLAAGALPRHATDAAVARLVVRLHRLNRAVIGPDPDLIRPGQRLRLPVVPPGEDRP